MTTSGSDGRVTGLTETVYYPKKRRQWDGASLREDSTGHPQRGPTRFPSLVAPTLSEGREFG